MELPPRVVFCQYRGPAPPMCLHGNGLVDVLQTRQPDEVLPKLAAVEEAVRGGLHAAGFIAYEAAPSMDPACRTHPAGRLPLVWFALFRELVEQDGLPPGRADGFSIGRWLPSITPAQHRQSVDRIKDYIARGHTYQVNYTFRLRRPSRAIRGAFFIVSPRRSAGNTGRMSIPAGTSSARPRPSCSSASTASGSCRGR